MARSMSREALTVAVSAACEVLTDLRHSADEEKTEGAIRDLSQLFYHHPQRRTSLFRAVWARSGVSALLGILRSSQSIPILAEAAGCLALLVQDNCEAAFQLATCDVISLLLPLLFPRSREQTASADLTIHSPYPLSSPLSWQKEWLPVYEATLASLRKLTYHSPALQKTLADEGGVRLIIELSSSADFIASCSSFTESARETLVGLTLGKKCLCHAVATPDRCREEVLKAFSALSSSPGSSSLSLYPSYIVDLMCGDGEWVADCLVASQEVWPSHASFPKGAEPVWTCVCVTCVEDGGNVWGQFCIEQPKPKIDAMAAVLREMPPPPSADSHCTDSYTLAIGELCLAYFDPSDCHAPSCITVPLWGRGRLLGVEPGARLRLLSIDYGVTATLPFSHILPLPPQCKGIPPLAIPCKVLGVAPVSVCTVVQENSAGILRNLAFEKAAFRKEIVAFGGVEALLKFSLSCDVGVAEQATAALLNMAASEELKSEMGERGAVDTLLALVLRDPPHPSLLPLSLGALYTLTAHTPHNKRRLLNQRSVGKLAAMLNHSLLGEKEREILAALVRILDAAASPGSYRNERGQGGVRGESSLSPRQQQASRSSTSPQKREHVSHGSPGVRRRPVVGGGEGRGTRKPREGHGKVGVVYRCLGDQGSSEGGMVTSEEGDGGGGTSGGVATNQTYVFNSMLPYKEDETHAFRDVGSVRDISQGYLQRCICAMINSGRLCTMYVGVSAEGKVRGVQLDRAERDQLSAAFDSILLHRLSPAVKHHRYKVLYVPVVSRRGALQAPPHSHVLQLEIKGSGVGSRGEVYVAVSGKDGEKAEQCFYRYGKTNVQVSPQELRDKLAKQESCGHGNEISSLLQNIGTLKVTLNQLTSAQN